MRGVFLLPAFLSCGLWAQPAAPVARWWEQEPLRLLDLVTSLGDIAFRPPAELAVRKSRQFYNSEHLDIMGMRRGLDDQGFFFSSKVAGRSNRDYLREYLPEARRRGIRVMIYFNVHWYTTDFGEKHPEWRQIREDGSPLTGVYETGTDFCVNGPWREWCFQVLRDLCAYPIDGIFYDGPIFRADTCYCRHCQDKFRKAYGRPLPSKKERTGAGFKDLMEFQANSLADFLRDSNRIIKSANPEIAFYMNGGVRGANWATARFNRVLVPEQDLLGSEGGFISGDLTRVSLWKPGLTARLLETQAPGKPRVIFSAASHKPWTFSVLPEAELRLLYAGSIANAASVWFGITPFEFDQPEMKTLVDMNRFLAANGRYYLGTRSEARVAVVWSETTASFYAGADAQMIDIDRVPSRSEVGNLEGEFGGLSEALIRAHAPFDVIDDVTLEREPLARYQAIFLPNVACMSQTAAGRLRDYVRGGGNLFATFETSLYDETGVRRKDFALAELFGVSAEGKIAGPNRWDFMKPVAAGGLLSGLKREMIPATFYHVRVKPQGGRALLQYTQPLAGRYDGIPGLSDDPALVTHSFGQGSVAYFSGDFGNLIAGFHVPELLQVAENALRILAPPPVRIENAPGSLEVVLRSQQQGKRLLLHLVNSTGEMTRPIRRVMPLYNLRITLDQAGDAAKLFTLVRPRPLAWQKDKAGNLQFVLPRVDEYEVVVFER
ncbi:MAG: hypothetical protein FJW34_10530 [Acidobacteria bacterium]|nr:hypothetical protein [Acidobacteriota bacterium]